MYLLSLVDELNFFSFVNEATTEKGTVLDLDLSNEEEVLRLDIEKNLPSDHYAVIFSICISYTLHKKEFKEEYNWKLIDSSEFANLFEKELEKIICGLMLDADDFSRFILFLYIQSIGHL